LMRVEIRWVNEDSDGDQLHNPIISFYDDWSIKISVDKDGNEFSFVA
jgi:hypothetical protein